jgi:hypothetical protein
MPTFLDYYIPYPGRGIVAAASMQENEQVKVYDETSIDEIIIDLLDQDLIVTHERPYYNFRRAMAGYEHILEQYHVKERWLDIFTEVRKATDGKQIALSKLVKSTIGEEADLSIRRLANSYGDPDYKPNLADKVEDRLIALKELYSYILKFNQVSYEQNGTVYWAEVIINESPPLED